jgi:ribonuclease HI
MSFHLPGLEQTNSRAELLAVIAALGVVSTTSLCA